MNHFPADDAPEPAAPAQEEISEEWLPIETAPKDGTLIVLGARNGVWLGKYLPVYGSGYRPENPWSSMLMNHDHMAERYTRPSHWMPLPPPPGARRSESVRDQALEEAAKVCEEERVSEPTDNDGDAAYNVACGHCADAIRALKEKS